MSTILNVKCFSKGDATNFYHFLIQQLHGLWRYSNENLSQTLNFYYDGPYTGIIKQIPFLNLYPLSEAPEDCVAVKPIKTHDRKIAHEYSNYLKSIFLPKIITTNEKNVLIFQRAQNRIIKNDDQLVYMLQQFGKVNINTIECLPFIKQIECIRNAKIVISAHGAGLAHMIFADPGTIFIEIYNKGFHSHYPYRDMAKIYNLKHSHIEAYYSSTELYSQEDQAYIESFKDSTGKIDAKILLGPEYGKLRALIRDSRYIKADVTEIYKLITNHLS